MDVEKYEAFLLGLKNRYLVLLFAILAFMLLDNAAVDNLIIIFPLLLISYNSFSIIKPQGTFQFLALISVGMIPFGPVLLGLYCMKIIYKSFTDIDIPFSISGPSKEGIKMHIALHHEIMKKGDGKPMGCFSA
ncbi:hypothetical protein D3C87_587500 [compost metagenome]